ncbi:uncharacterized protein LOC123028112 isoform X2 [Varanus komodoensis]|uniref:uncharacterized protein LOC123028112 isoform X2 n=1 Tax=Varanus komodoensis TaxID=61221 RepID=UPI001CF791FF|nr:uncharacterized protein LOC123028112 isoform X2 [Varanus komodoensis]
MSVHLLFLRERTGKWGRRTSPWSPRPREEPAGQQRDSPCMRCLCLPAALSAPGQRAGRRHSLAAAGALKGRVETQLARAAASPMRMPGAQQTHRALLRGVARREGPVPGQEPAGGVGNGRGGGVRGCPVFPRLVRRKAARDAQGKRGGNRRRARGSACRLGPPGQSSLWHPRTTLRLQHRPSQHLAEPCQESACMMLLDINGHLNCRRENAETGLSRAGVLLWLTYQKRTSADAALLVLAAVFRIIATCLAFFSGPSSCRLGPENAGK